MSDQVPRLAPRSVVAIADLELLRIARSDLDDPPASGGRGIGRHLRGLRRPATGGSHLLEPGPVTGGRGRR